MAKRQVFQSLFQFLRERFSSGTTFSYDDLKAVTNWKPISINTYLSKWLGEVVELLPNNQLRVLPRFRHYDEQQFLSLARQKRSPRATYTRYRYGEIVTYEFLLPLTREDQLRRTLDELFYSDTIQQRLIAVGLDKTETYFARIKSESDEAYVARICASVSQKFGGYSISHVSGRFRAADLTSRGEAARMLEENRRYIIDETTASVRFIVPIDATKVEKHDLRADVVEEQQRTQTAISEIALVHGLFFDLFVEAIVELVNGEDIIWLIEEAAQSRSLYVWERT